MAGANSSIGFKSYVKAWFETTEKTLPTTVNAFNLSFDTNSVVGTQANIANNSMNGTRNPNQTSLGSKSVTGSLPSQVDEKSSLFWSKALLGSYTKQAVLKSDTTLSNDPTVWAAITDGAFKITINGTAQDVTAVDFTGDTTMAMVAATLQTKIRAANIATGFTGATVTWDNTHTGNYRMVIKSGTVDSAAAVAAATGTSAIALLATITTPAGTDLSPLLKMNTGHGTVCYERICVVGDVVPSFGIEKGFEQQIFTLYGCKTGKMGLAYDGQGSNRLTMTMDVTGASEDAVSATVINGSTTNLTDGALFSHFEARVIPYSGGNEIDRGKIETFSCDMNNSLKPIYTLSGSPECLQIDAGKIALTGQAKVLFKAYANSFMSDARVGTLIPISIVLKHGVNEFTINLLDCKFEVISPSQDTATSVEVTVKYNATNVTIKHVSAISADML